jgi:hypothetical protein
MDKMVIRRELPYVRRLRSIYRVQVVCGATIDGKKKVMKKQRRSKIKV